MEANFCCECGIKLDDTNRTHCRKYQCENCALKSIVEYQAKYFVNVTAKKRAEKQAEKAKQQAEGV